MVAGEEKVMELSLQKEGKSALYCLVFLRRLLHTKKAI
jgi:hypothetical protein